MTYKTTIYVWSDVGNTPITKREGSYCDELLRLETECADPAEAKALTQKLVRGIAHGYSGYYDLPDYPNQNTRNGFTH
jgi:hypothetical protein